MEDKTFKTELNYEQVDVFAKDETLFVVDGEEHTYFNVTMDWGLHLYECTSELDIVPFIDRIQVSSGDSVSSNKMIIVKHDFVDIVSPDIGEKFNKGNWRVKFNFLRDDLKDKNIIIEPGDVIEYDNEFYEIDESHSSQYWRGTNPATDLGLVEGDRGEFGYSVAVRGVAHVTRRNRLNIQEVRTGINKPNSIPRNL